MRTFKPMAIGVALGLAGVLCVAQIGPTPPLISGGVSSSIINNLFTNTTVYFDNFNSTVINAISNFTQNISVSGKATFNQITVTNQLQFTTNAFPRTAGTTWNFSKSYQNIITNNDWQITAIAGLTNYLINWSVVEWSNSDSATHFCDLSTIPWHVIGQSSTNKVYLGAGKVAFMSALIRGVASSNLTTGVEQ